ncbi:MAG TPA: MarR family transcriptional regulator [Solirubrobacteraceae bacterium]|nr:MarR family transcriptional regulator [Solirubrobacteraceae bacterium]
MQSLQVSKAELLVAQLLALGTQVAQRGESRAMDVAAELDLSLSQIRALLAVWRADEPLSLGSLAREVGLSDAAAVRMVDGLLRGGLVLRREDDRDRRIKRITLSEAGNGAVAELVAAKRDGLERFTRALTQDELGALTGAFEPIVARLGLRLDLGVGR